MTIEEIAELAHYAETVYGMVAGDVSNKFGVHCQSEKKDVS